MRKPTIHQNGTGAEALFDQTCEVLGALRNAIRKIEEHGPNGRDYYPQGAEALREAVDEHRARIERIAAVVREYEEIAEYIADVRDGVAS